MNKVTIGLLAGVVLGAAVLHGAGRMQHRPQLMRMSVAAVRWTKLPADLHAARYKADPTIFPGD